MKIELKRMGILQTGKLLAIFYGLFSLILLPFLLVAMTARPDQGGAWFFVLIMYPLAGFIGGILGAAMYNLTARIAGGMHLELFEVAPPRQPVQSPYEGPVPTVR